MTTTDPTMNGSNGATTSAIVKTASDPGRAISAFSGQSEFEAAQRMAKALGASTLVPAAYQHNVPNVLIAMEMAARIGASVFMVMQSLDIIHGRPSWSSKFLIATVNASGRFTPLRFRWEGKPGTDAWGCRAVAKDRESGEECVGPLVSIALAKAEGWYAKNGSKWRTMPELMLMYRSAGFWSRVYCPEISLGLTTSEETVDTFGGGRAFASVELPEVASPKSLEAALLADDPAPAAPAPSSPAAPVEDPPDFPAREPGADDE